MPTPAESTADIPFPVGGLNVVTEFGEQPDGTAPDAENVRGYDPFDERVRGGSRPGLDRYIDAQIPAGETLIQHLEMIVDPRYTALPISLTDPEPDWTENPNIPGQFYPPGGSGDAPNPNATQPNPPSTHSLRQSKAVGHEYDLTGAAKTSSFDSVPLGNSLLVIAVATISNNNTVGVTVRNGAGTSFTQAGSYQTYTDNGVSGEQRLSVWYKVASVSDDQDVVVDPADEAAMVVGLHEFRGYATSSPLDSTNGASDSNLFAASPMTPGAITVSGNDALVFAAFMASYSPDTTTLSAGFTRAVDHPDGTVDATDIQLYTSYKLTNATASNPTPTATLDGGADQWAAIGASFKD